MAARTIDHEAATASYFARGWLERDAAGNWQVGKAAGPKLRYTARLMQVLCNLENLTREEQHMDPQAPRVALTDLDPETGEPLGADDTDEEGEDNE